jgi:uncharacterized protein (DUF1499 family)
VNCATPGGGSVQAACNIVHTASTQWQGDLLSNRVKDRGLDRARSTPLGHPVSREQTIAWISASRNLRVQMQLRSHVYCALAVSLLLAGCTSPPNRPPTLEALPECGWLPNCVNSESGRGVQAIEPLRANAGQWQNLKGWIAQQEDWEVTVDDGNFIQAVVVTPVMRFRDDVQLLFLPDAQLIQVRSSSRLGLSDLGTNARRMETLRDQLAP